MHKHHINYEIRGYFSGEDTVLTAVEHGLGIGLVSRSYILGATGFSVTPFRVEDIDLSFTMKLIYHRDKFIFPEFAEFLSFSKQYVRALFESRDS